MATQTPGSQHMARSKGAGTRIAQASHTVGKLPWGAQTMGQERRIDDSGPAPARSDRFYQLEGEWFFATREGSAMGPFITRDEAAEGLNDYLEFLELAKPRIRRKLVAAMES